MVFHQTGLVISIKLVIFLSFWQIVSTRPNTSASEPFICVHLWNQQILLSLLKSSGVTTANKRVQRPYISIGIPSILLCIEMALFSVMHIWAYDWKPYTMSTPSGGLGPFEFALPEKFAYQGSRIESNHANL
jgi:hypothetical protein